jgi:Tripartite tricarboxylate transporter TctB family
MLTFRLASLLTIVAFAALLGVQSAQIAGMARVYPTVLVVLVIAGSLLIAVQDVVTRATTAPLDAELKKLISVPARIGWRLAGFVAVWLVYPWLLSSTGFIVATTCAISLSLWLLKVKRMFFGILGAVMFSVAFSILFATVLYIPTPSGIIDDWLAQMLFALSH